eukprot:11965994-Alexandrium_andersonii.AAC.1
MLFYEIRAAIFKALRPRYQGVKLGGSPDEYAVDIDETFLPKNGSLWLPGQAIAGDEDDRHGRR